MLRLYIKDIFTEGLGDIFFMRNYNFLNRIVKNAILYKILLVLHVLIYLIFIALVMLILFKINYPL